MMISLRRQLTPSLIAISRLLLLFSSVSNPSLALSTSNTSPPWKESAIRAADLLKDAKSVLFVTGAGISAESGLPTYRGVSGLYNDGGTAIKEEGMSIEECLSGSTYRRSPQTTWKYLLQIERACRGAEPSRAHALLAKAEQHIPRVAVMTQNVDGLHNRAGSSRVLSLHGNLYKLYCSSCGSQQTVDSYHEYDSPDATIPPICQNCGGAIRPAVVLFDEYLGDDTVQTYEEMLGMSMSSLMFSWGVDRSLEERPFDVSICIGTSALFAYVNAAALSGKRTIEINPTETSLSSLVDVRVSAGATEALEFIFDRLGWSD